MPFSVQANQTPTARSGAIVVASQRLMVAQAGAPCRFDLSRTRDTIASGGGRLSVDVSTLSGCSWSATSGASWIAIVSGQTGNASGTVVLAVAANAGGARVGSMNVAGQTYTVAQDGTSTAPSPSPTPTPTPTPTPPPPSFTPKKIDFSGKVSGLTGKCPVLLFKVGSDTVVTDAGTEYKHGNCGDLSNGDAISGSGLTQQNGTIAATSIELNKDQ